jgi:hypothetical protein
MILHDKSTHVMTQFGLRSVSELHGDEYLAPYFSRQGDYEISGALVDSLLTRTLMSQTITTRSGLTLALGARMKVLTLDSKGLFEWVYADRCTPGTVVPIFPLRGTPHDFTAKSDEGSPLSEASIIDAQFLGAAYSALLRGGDIPNVSSILIKNFLDENPNTGFSTDATVRRLYLDDPPQVQRFFGELPDLSHVPQFIRRDACLFEAFMQRLFVSSPYSFEVTAGAHADFIQELTALFLAMGRRVEVIRYGLPNIPVQTISLITHKYMPSRVDIPYLVLSSKQARPTSCSMAEVLKDRICQRDAKHTATVNLLRNTRPYFDVVSTNIAQYAALTDIKLEDQPESTADLLAVPFLRRVGARVWANGFLLSNGD